MIYLTFANVPSGVFDRGIPVDIGEQPQAEAVGVVGRVCEAVDDDAGVRGVERLPDPVVELVVNDGAPELRLLILHRLQTCQQTTKRSSETQRLCEARQNGT